MTRFHNGALGNDRIVVIDCDEATYNKLPGSERIKHILIDIKVGGMVSEQLARTWADQLTSQLNQFDAANAAVAKLA